MTWSDLSPSEHDAGTILLRDALGIASAGTRATGLQPTLDALHALGPGDVPVPWTDLRLPAPQAALATSALVHAWDFDDTHDDAVVHTMAVALPAALAAGTQARRCGRDILDGLVVGVQVLSRLALAVGPQPGMVRTAGLGALAAAAAAARTIGLGPEGIGNAMALALPAAGSPHSRQVVEDSAVNKRLQPGFAVQAGITAAFLAQAGVEGPAGWADGTYGLLTHASGTTDVLSAPGWEGAHLSLKPYPACRYTHAAIAAAAEAAAGIPVRRVARVDVHVPDGAAYALVSRPFARRGRPVIDAQFSIPWLVAAQLVTGAVDLTTIAGPTLLDADVEAFATRVTVHQDAHGTATMAPATVVLHTDDGQRREVTAPMPGSPEHPLTEAQLAAKTAACARVGGHDPDHTVTAIAELAKHFADLSPTDVAPALAALGC
ncbi:MmgE/PrpD family protein [Prauserella oleivorans]|uniref:MmgE/PrpD family protein n=1 Tax=Prauserella oleivorans TaxID=1478153 RepID=A0ABW5W362_9PSEU